MQSSNSSFIGKQIGNYRIVSELASGAFGSVYQSQHTFLTERKAALKVLHMVHLGSDEERTRFIQEAQFPEKLKHPYILPVLDVGLYENMPYLLIEYAPNGSLRSRLQKQGTRPLPINAALAILSQVGQALHYAHQQHIIHRDLKPENILFNARNEAVLADFGIAIALATSSVKFIDATGTPAYMAPEQFKGEVSRATDQYSLGCIAYELFTGRRPFNAPDFVSMGFLHVTEQPPLPRQINPYISDHIEQAILKAMAKQRTARYADIGEFLMALQVQLAQPAHYGGNEQTFITPHGSPLPPTMVAFPTPVRMSETPPPPPMQQRNTDMLQQRIITDIDQKTAQQWLNTGNSHFSAKRYKEALAVYEQVLQLAPNDLAYRSKGNALLKLKRYDEALVAYDQAIRINPNDTNAYNNRGATLCNLKRYGEAFAAYDQAIRLSPNNAKAYYNRGYALNELMRYNEALFAYDQAIQLDPNFASAYYYKGITLKHLGRIGEAKQYFKKARQLGYEG